MEKTSKQRDARIRNLHKKAGQLRNDLELIIDELVELGPTSQPISAGPEGSENLWRNDAVMAILTKAQDQLRAIGMHVFVLPGFSSYPSSNEMAVVLHVGATELSAVRSFKVCSIGEELVMDEPGKKRLETETAYFFAESAILHASCDAEDKTA